MTIERCEARHPALDMLCVMDGVHASHGVYTEGKWHFWEPAPDARRQRRRPTTKAMVDLAHAIEANIDGDPTPVPLGDTSPERLYRPDGPETSKRAAGKLRTGSQKHLLLVAYAAHPDGLTDDEAAHHAGLLHRVGSCWWHRSSDLRDEGRIEETGRTRLSPFTNEERMVCVITDFGREALLS